VTDETRQHNPSDPLHGGEPAGETTSPHDAVGAYVLHALPETEHASFERHVEDCPECQREITALRPVVGLLPRLLDLEPPVAESGDPTDLPAAPSVDLRDRILAAAREDLAGLPPVTTAEAPPVDEEPLAAPTPLPVGVPRPRGRIRPGFSVAPGSVPEPIRRRERGTPSPGWLAAALLAVAFMGSLIWGIVEHGRASDRGAEVASLNDQVTGLNQQLADVRRRANATAYVLTPTEGAPSDSHGNVLYSLSDKFGVLYVQGLPVLPQDHQYQVWYLKGEEALPGNAFGVDDKGRGVVTFTTDVPTLDGVALTVEPAGGSPKPTTAIVMAGTVGGAAG